MKINKMYWLLLPGLLFLTVFMLIPIILTIGSTFVQEGKPTLEGYLYFFRDAYFNRILLTTLRVSVFTTVICIALGYPVAYYISRLGTRKKGILLALSIFPLLTSPVVRSFSWMIILGRKGLVNNALVATGIVDKPIEILYTPTAMIIGLVHLFLPLIIITLVGVMENVDIELIRAAESLGASRFTALRKVLFPLTIPGLIIGSVLVFVGSLTAYTTPALLGGKERVISTFLYQNAMTLNDWYLASVIATIMIVITLVVVGLMNKVATKLNPKG
ncbi:putative spermidine/putrescine transport system permease protein [Paenibacillus sp. SORGH_AS306]|uniref:ABC transporter permease n=1 Tax=unclassified Paenibacillus TaxID=185978 RepID=UPI002788FC3F|nr:MULTISPECIES: ABC transporter permease [unclassified Paenibacillus]MDQ1236081.1 putative spermidine/putrescine transport system permease protein [Paenibacillus sp. SORGH_AS_0306]MDR6108437.1 putative spermidine/putrescine transport system permease protein [Paenibacillus sp. SORGH_AS_0338]